MASPVPAGLEMLVIPALFTKISRSGILLARAITSLSFVKSATSPFAPISVARSWIRVVVDVMITSAPNSRSALAEANPIPFAEPAPVTRAIFPARENTPLL